MSRIVSLSAKTVADSRGEQTIEVTAQTQGGSAGTAAVPQGKSTGSFEARYIEPQQAIESVTRIIRPALAEKDFSSQRDLDMFLCELDGTPIKEKLGANAILATSLACARAIAHEEGKSLWQYVREAYGGDVHSQAPRLHINVINGGLHAHSNLTIQEFLVIPSADTIFESLQIAATLQGALEEHFAPKDGEPTVEFGDEGGFSPNCTSDLEPFEILSSLAERVGVRENIRFGIDAAASNITTEPDKLVALYREMRTRFGLSYLEDPFGEHDFDLFAGLLEEFSGTTLIVGDDLTTTNPKRMEEAAAHKSVNAVIIKPNQIGSLTETLDAVRFARSHDWQVIVSHRSGETTDDFIADIAWGVGADGVKFGAPVQEEREVKYNRLLCIEREETARL